VGESTAQNEHFFSYAQSSNSLWFVLSSNSTGLTGCFVFGIERIARGHQGGLLMAFGSCFQEFPGDITSDIQGLSNGASLGDQSCRSG